MNKKISVTIVVPAFNEEKNIRKVIKSILSQNQKNYILEKLLIISDGSTDNTIAEINKVKNNKIILIDDTKRLGKVKRLNYAYKSNQSDVLAQFDADIILKDKNTLENLVTPFIIDKKVTIVYGNPVPKKPKEYIGKLSYFGFEYWEEAKKMINAERYNCFGCITAYSKTFLKKYRLPEDSSYAEDTYSFYYAKQNGLVTFFQKSAIVYYKLPLTFLDYVKQMNRYLTTSDGLMTIFDHNLICKYDTIKYSIKLKAFLKNSLNGNLKLGLGYFILQVIANIYTIFHKQNNLWDISKSSK